MTLSHTPSRGAHAHLIRSDAEALSVARALAADFAQTASARDRERRLPFDEVERFSASGLWGITVPRAFGGAAVSHVTLAEVTALISEADPALGQIPQNHYCLVDAVRLIGNGAQQDFFFREALEGRRFGNAVSESGTANAKVVSARLVRTPGGLRLDGRKFYCTGALFAHWVPVAAKDEEDAQVLVYVARETPGLQVLDDWTGFGQRTTASGTVTAENVAVDALQVLPRAKLFEPATIHGPFAQILHAAIDLGIGRAAMADLRVWLRERARPWPDSGVTRAADDPLTLSRAGELLIQQHAAEALLQRAGRHLDEARDDPTAERITEASIAVAEAKVLTTEFALRAATTLIELGGTQATLSEHNLDRHWRNARTHTVHDPVRWKPHAVGNHWLNGANPQRHASI